MKIKGGEDRLGRKINKLRKDMEKYQATKSALASGYWRGRKIVTLSEWFEILDERRDDIFDYVPNEHYRFELKQGLISTLANNDPFMKEKIESWYRDYADLLAHLKNKKVGKQECGGCLLNPDSDDPVGILRFFLSQLPISFPARNAGLGGKTLFPCRVVNRFECPYKDKGIIGLTDEGLIGLGLALHVIYESIKMAWESTKKEDSVYYVNFKTGQVSEEKSDLPYRMRNHLELWLGNLHLSPVQIKSIQDISNALTDREKLDSLVQQYAKYNIPMMDESQRETLVELWIKGKNNLRVVDLKNIDGETLEEERRLREAKSQQPESQPSRGGACAVCGTDRARIQCVNCDCWICFEHWREHKREVHADSTAN
jgi:hypothetical protein